MTVADQWRMSSVPTNDDVAERSCQYLDRWSLERVSVFSVEQAGGTHAAGQLKTDDAALVASSSKDQGQDHQQHPLKTHCLRSCTCLQHQHNGKWLSTVNSIIARTANKWHARHATYGTNWWQNSILHVGTRTEGSIGAWLVGILGKAPTCTMCWNHLFASLWGHRLLTRFSQNEVYQ